MSGTLSDTLNSLREAGGLDLVAVVGSDGLMIDSSHVPDIDAESLCALAASGLLMMDAMGRELEQGIAKQAILEYETSVAILTPLQEDLVLVALTRGDSNLGRVRLVLRRGLSEVNQAVSQI
ncbi:MAG TPA: roadblock/LC7 domain-containing protein [Nitrolancea sp.]|jgi:predicted regulator of Ras-like GTPase activity (Roadblock/LC7/MglB family)|nr:roadblock/LC7 domain-containing protein [Nitrolancea sp.]